MKLEVQEPPRHARTFVLTLTEDEASALTALIGNVGGQSAPRSALDSIWIALDDRFPNREPETCEINGIVFELRNEVHSVEFQPVKS